MTTLSDDTGDASNNRSDSFDSDGLLHELEKTRRRRYYETVIEALCASRGTSIVLTESEEPPQAGDIPLADTPTFCELATYIEDALRYSGALVPTGGVLELLCHGHAFDVHVLFGQDAASGPLECTRHRGSPATLVASFLTARSPRTRSPIPPPTDCTNTADVHSSLALRPDGGTEHIWR